MSSSNHPTSNIENAFSLNLLDFILASPNYVPTPPRKTYSSSSNSFGEVPIASPSLLLFHNDPYMKILQAFYAKESPVSPPNPITPPVILTPSLVLPSSPLFDPRHFFVPEELLLPKKQIHPPSSSSTTLSNSSQKQSYILVPPSFSICTPTPPQIYELGKSSIKTRVKHHEEQVETKKVLHAATSPCHYISRNCITMSSPDHSISNNEDAFSSNIPDYVSTILDYFHASTGKTYSNDSNDSTGKIPPEFSHFYNMKDIQAFYAKELPIPSPDPITLPVILTPSPVLPPSLLFDP
nr:hypothetical protein [Tanacetum cinerariifolium]